MAPRLAAWPGWAVTEAPDAAHVSEQNFGITSSHTFMGQILFSSGQLIFPLFLF